MRLSHIQASLQSEDNPIQTLPPGSSPFCVRIISGPSATLPSWALLPEITPLPGPGDSEGGSIREQSLLAAVTCCPPHPPRPALHPPSCRPPWQLLLASGHLHVPCTVSYRTQIPLVSLLPPDRPRLWLPFQAPPAPECLTAHGSSHPRPSSHTSGTFLTAGLCSGCPLCLDSPSPHTRSSMFPSVSWETPVPLPSTSLHASSTGLF